MLILTAEGSSSGQSDSWEISANAVVTLGRHSRNNCSVPWDDMISRNHAEISAEESSLRICCLPGSRSPIWKDGQTHMAVDVSDGESFRIGQTWFAVTIRTKQLPVVDIIDQGMSTADHTTSVLMSPADLRMSVVSQSSTALWKTTSERELAEQALLILHQVLNFAQLLVILSCRDVASANRPKIIHWHKNRSGVQATVSRELIAQAMGQGETAIEVESDALGGAVKSGRWNFCVPVTSDAAVPWCIYVGGTFGETDDYGPFMTPEKLRSDASVTQLVAHLTGAIRSVRALEDRFEGVRQFFSPRLLDKVTSRDSTASELAPRETEIVAIYCDLRGFSRMVSEGAHDLHALLSRISEALGIMTQSIIEHDGVIADFQGDSALGFWGWPVALTHGAIPACRAALQIQRIFQMATASDSPDGRGFQVGIGIASGRAIAGRIGTQDHAKIGVFGPVVNVASRLEGLTKKVGATILVDRSTAAAIRSHLPQEEGRCRPIGSIQPVGFDRPISVSELLPPESQSTISSADIENYVDAVAAFRTGEWDRCRKLLGLLPADDRPRDFLLVQIASHNYQPPPGWSGIIHVDSK